MTKYFLFTMLLLVFTPKAWAEEAPISPACQITARVIQSSSVTEADIRVMSVMSQVREGDPELYKDFTCETGYGNFQGAVRIPDQKFLRLKGGQRIMAVISHQDKEDWNGEILESIKVMDRPAPPPPAR